MSLYSHREPLQSPWASTVTVRFPPKFRLSPHQHLSRLLYWRCKSSSRLVNARNLSPLIQRGQKRNAECCSPIRRRSSSPEERPSLPFSLSISLSLGLSRWLSRRRSFSRDHLLTCHRLIGCEPRKLFRLCGDSEASARAIFKWTNRRRSVRLATSERAWEELECHGHASLRKRALFHDLCWPAEITDGRIDRADGRSTTASPACGQPFRRVTAQHAFRSPQGDLAKFAESDL